MKARAQFVGMIGVGLGIIAGCGSTKTVYVVGAAPPTEDGGTSTEDAGTPAETTPPAAPQLGVGDHTSSSVVFTEIAAKKDGLNRPRDLAFNPLRPDELWIVNGADDSVTIVHDASTDGRKSEHRTDGYALHFMPTPAALAFGQDETTTGFPGTFATCSESRNTYHDQMEANDFMGPALWSSDLSIFAKKNPNGLGSHLDMLHNTPLCMGISHEGGNRYWAFGGQRGSIDRYDFKIDDGIGNDDHSDGESYHYVAGKMKYVPGVPSHLAYSATEEMVYAADTGHARIVKLDAKSGTPGKAVTPKEPMGTAVMMDGAKLTELVSADSGLLERPSGLELRDGLVFVSDNATSVIGAFDASGERVNYLETGRPEGSLAGMAFGPDGKLYFVDMKSNRVFRIDAP